MKRTELNLAERRTIEDLLYRKVNVTEIARRINRHRSTVYREIKRNFYKDQELPQLDGYYGMNAQKFTAERRVRRRKLVRIPALRDAVIDRLQEGWSPEQIAGRLKFEGHVTTVSHETIYAYVYSPDGQSQALARYLPDRRKKRKPRYARTARGMMFPLERSIHKRPEHIKDRSTFGDWEGDLMIGKGHKSALGTLVERTTRMVFLVKIKAKKADHVREAFADVFQELDPELKKSLTYDRGHEIAEHKFFTEATGIPVYFCDPSSPWQRGANENTNGLLRQYYPKGTDFNKVTEEDLKRVQDQLNKRPRKVLNWDSPYKAFNKLTNLNAGAI